MRTTIGADDTGNIFRDRRERHPDGLPRGVAIRDEATGAAGDGIGVKRALGGAGKRHGAERCGERHGLDLVQDEIDVHAAVILRLHHVHRSPR